jgi:RNA polymerase sigma-70 factor (ECF subfamily)
MAELEQAPDPAGKELEAIWDEEWHQNLLVAVLARVKRQVNARHYQIYDCYVLKQWPVKDVARTFGVNAGQVYLIKHRLSSLVKAEITKLDQRML